MKIKNQEEKVKEMLTKYPKTRDNDSLLLAGIWSQQMGGPEKTKDMTARDFMIELSKGKDGKLSNPVSVWRARQKIQEHNAEMRGKEYKNRHKNQEPVKEEIRTWNDADQTEMFNEKKNKGDYSG